jgi:hypothetical protein
MGHMNDLPARRRSQFLLLLFGCAFVLSLFTVFEQVAELGVPFIDDGGMQAKRHLDVLQGTAPDPWQYRVLSEYVVAGVRLILVKVGFPAPTIYAFMMVRLFQNLFIFVCAALYYEKLGLNRYAVFVGLALLTWGMIHSIPDTDLSFNTYTDLIFYLLAGLLILNQRYLWIIPLTALAALNRETGGLIPVMLLAATVHLRPKFTAERHAVGIAGSALVLFALIYVGLRMIYGPRPMFIPYDRPPGLPLFLFNVGQPITWMKLFATFGILPLLALVAFRRWPDVLRAFFWAIIPIWLGVHLFMSVLAETRLLLVPHTLVIIPGVLFGMIHWRNPVPVSVHPQL